MFSGDKENRLWVICCDQNFRLNYYKVLTFKKCRAYQSCLTEFLSSIWNIFLIMTYVSSLADSFQILLNVVYYLFMPLLFEEISFVCFFILRFSNI
jgi:hypothetical protein